MDYLPYMELARQNLLTSEGNLIPAILLFQNDDLMGAMLAPFKDDEQKYNSLKAAGVLARKNGCTSALFICDAAMRKFENAQQAAYAHENWNTEAPLTYPEGSGVRVECLVLAYLNFKTGEKSNTTQVYKKENGTYVFGEVTTLTEVTGGVFNSLVYGYENPDCSLPVSFIQPGDVLDEPDSDSFN